MRHLVSYALLGALPLVALVACGDDSNGADATSADGGASVGGSSGGSGGANTGGNDGGGGLGDPTPTPEEWTQLQSLRYVAEVPADVTNQWADDAAAAAFGHRLFFEKRLSGPLIDGDNDGSANALGNKGETGRVACAGCHIPTDEFVDTRSLGQQISLAAGWVIRRTPSLLDVGHRQLLNWDARRDSTWSQAIGVFESSREMNTSRLYVAEQVFEHHQAEYEAIFGAMPPLDDPLRFPPLSADNAGCAELDAPTNACHGKPGDEAEFDSMSAVDQDAVTRVAVNVGKALGAYLRRLDCGESRFDAWLDGDAVALTPAEKRGALAFIGQGKCIDCHDGPQLSDLEFHNAGMIPKVVAVVFLDKDDPGASVGLTALLTDPLRSDGAYSDGYDGRLPMSVDPKLLGAFRTPSLRCSSQRPSFMHTAQMASIEEVVRFFARGGHPAGYLGESELTDVGLDEQQILDITAFIGALDGPGPSAALQTPLP